MRVFRVVYDEDSNFILEVFNKIEGKFIVEFFSLDKRKDQKTARGIQTSMGTKEVPIIQILDENLEIVGGIWKESNPDWEEEINNIINESKNYK